MNEITAKQAVEKQSQGDLIEMEGQFHILGGNGLTYKIFVAYPYKVAEQVSIEIAHEYCLQCKDGCFNCVRECTTEICPLFLYRLGDDPSRKVN